MKILISILILFSYNIYGQNIKFSKGKILDSNTDAPIPFTKIIKGNFTTITDFEGFFSFDSIKFDTSSINIICAHYKDKYSKVEFKEDTLIIKLIPDTFDLEIKAQIHSKPIDTTYYKNEIIKQINYQHNESISYYKNGKVGTISADDITRTWYSNGVIKYQSIKYSSHMYKVSEWYKNGKLKSHSTMIWSAGKKGEESSYKEYKNW
jgi:hypothetical protein